ncbi:MAG: hypothetical protein SFX74_07990 [Fimbriimonadaceae bacterium]|nr:hypothetical protein [Fimbriimonadaceae bacterium]
MRSWIALGVIAGISLALAGCAASPESRVIGNWQGDTKLSEIPNVPMPGVKQKIESGISTMQVKFTADKKFSLTGGLQQSTEGTWKVEDRKVTLEGGGQSIEAELSEDGKTMKLSIPLPAVKLVIGLRKTG